MASSASKKLLKEMPTEQAMKDTLYGLFASSDQAAAITGAAYLDHALKMCLKIHLREMSDAEEKRIFDGASNGILGTPSAKIRMAYAMWLIPDHIYQDLTTINGVRNCFAHTLHRLSFENEHIATECKKLKTFTGGAMGEEIIDGPKMRYVLNILAIYQYIRSDISRHILADVLDGKPMRRPSLPDIL